jgi:hypothetical protein
LRPAWAKKVFETPISTNNWVWWYAPGNHTSWRSRNRRVEVQAGPQQKVRTDLQNNIKQKGMGVAQVVEGFLSKPQYWVREPYNGLLEKWCSRYVYRPLSNSAETNEMEASSP